MVRIGMSLIKNEHGVYHVRRKVPKGLEEATATVLGVPKSRVSWLKETLGTKDEMQARVRAKPVMMKFDGILAKAEARLVEHPVRTELTEAEIKRIMVQLRTVINGHAVGKRSNPSFNGSLHRPTYGSGKLGRRHFKNPTLKCAAAAEVAWAACSSPHGRDEASIPSRNTLFSNKPLENWNLMRALNLLHEDFGLDTADNLDATEMLDLESTILVEVLRDDS
jgi:hypothetical protein